MWVEYDEVLAEVGLIEPEFVTILDGHYTHRVVNTALLVARVWLKEELDLPPSEGPSFRTELLEVPLPRYRQELRWRRSY